MPDQDEQEIAAPESKPCSYEGCEEEQWERSSDGFCIYHAKENGEDVEVAKQVWEEARKRAGRGGDCCFVGWQFPNDPEDAWFNGVTFSGRAMFHEVTFSGKALFRKTTFNGDTQFAHTIFSGDALFSGARFNGDVLFHNASFSSNAMFAGTVFSGNAFFPLKCEGRAYFSFPGWQAVRKGRFMVAFPFRHREEGETAYRLAKQSAQNSGDYRWAGDYHYAEQCAIEYGRRKEYGWKPWHKEFWKCLFELVFARGVFGYGEKPHRVLVTAGCVITLWAWLFCHFAAIKPSLETDTYSPHWKQCVHFSIVTFTTLGYGDFVPKERYRLLADAEALTGAALMALFVVALARKYTR